MNQYHRCIICLGSNYQGTVHLKSAERELKELSGRIHWGNIVETMPEEVSSAFTYLNRAALLQTSLDKETLIKEFKRIEHQHGRTSSSKQNGRIPLDIDLLIYDNEIIKPNDLNKNYVQQALKSLEHSVLPSLHLY